MLEPHSGGYADRTDEAGEGVRDADYDEGEPPRGRSGGARIDRAGGDAHNRRRGAELVQLVRDAAGILAGPFDGLFTLDSNKAEKAVNWGIAAVVWLALGRLIARFLVRR